ncbi:uncharacterized protein LOC116416723 [Nasonia vitripennis]|uniref:Double jelly roll-like domain-containing protein n=1 Tax=Nasonia vitripennis TaxID=7425 RepID=A0A7M7Q956_NASVI|nr:uncharacterized protein LOC116416723 [Nasonia vitripennis]
MQADLTLQRLNGLTIMATLTYQFHLTQVAVAGQNVYEDYQVEITKIEWLMPYVVLSDKHKIKLLNHLEKDRPITMSFCSWELYEYPLLPSKSKHVWTVKTANQLEKPRFVILGFQTNRKGRKTANASRFDHCNISNVTLFLNSQHYPYGNLNLNITNNQYALLYDMYANFQNAYYNKEVEPMLKKADYLSYAPLIVIDCSKQNESLKQASVDVRLEFEARANIPVGTSAYCLILHDRIVEYNPMSGDVKKIV